jgi:hypothetical protein
MVRKIMDKNHRWIRDYDRRRTEGFDSKPRLHSSRFNLENRDWNEIRQMPTPLIESPNLCFGTACSALRKSWFSLKLSKKSGIADQEMMLRICKLQMVLGFEISQFDELDPDYVRQELFLEKQQLQRDGLWEDEEYSLDVESEDPEESPYSSGEDPEEDDDDPDLSPEDRALYRRLRREERADKRERRAQNVNTILRQLGVTPREEEPDEMEVEEYNGY